MELNQQIPSYQMDVTQTRKKKKPRIIPPERRKKVAQACDSCKRRKQKCNGLVPCQMCTLKSFRCEYTAIDRRVLKPSKIQLERRRAQANLLATDANATAAQDELKVRRSTEPPAEYSEKQVTLQNTSSVSPVKWYQNPQEDAYQQMVHNEGQPYPYTQQSQDSYFASRPHGQYPEMSTPEPQVSRAQGIIEVPQNHPLRFYPPAPQQSQLVPSLTATKQPIKQEEQAQLNTQQYGQSLPQQPGSSVSSATALPIHLPFPVNIHDNDDSYNEAILSPENGQYSRILFDNCGNLCYIGESCPSSYLLQCRKVFAKVLGPNSFSDDPDRFTMVEAPNILRPHVNTGQLPDKRYADYLMKTYLNNSNNIVYILDDEVLKNHLERVYSNPASVSPKEVCILNLVFSIASVYAQVEVSNKIFPFPTELFIEPQVFIDSANAILNHTNEDGNLWLVESYLLLFFYYQFTGKRNTAWLRLGSAIRHAQALGLNRKYVNESFKDPAYVLHRRKLFRSLFIMDRLSSIHLGRSMTIQEKDWDDINAFDHIKDFQNRLLKVCILSGKILSEIYYNPSVSLKTALSLAAELKRHSQENPIKPITPENYARPVDHRYFLPHICHLNAIILLSRPFFHFVVLQKLGLVNYDKNTKGHLESFYQSCVKSSLLIIKIVEYVYHQNIHPFKPLSLISCTFHAGLIIGLLLLLNHKGIDHGIRADGNHEQDSDKMLVHALISAIKILHTYGEIDPPSKRYSDVLQKMLDVTQGQPEFNRAESYKQLNSLRANNQENYQNILRFKDWLFPKFDGIPENFTEYSSANSSASDGKQDEFLKDVADLNNIDTSGPLFLDDFLYNVIDSPNSAVNYQTYQF